jgi:hypothetical protein
VTTVILLLGSDLMCKVITRHCYSGKLLEKMHDVTFFHVFVGVGGSGGQWRYVFIKFYISNSVISIQFVLKSIQVTKNAFTVMKENKFGHQ